MEVLVVGSGAREHALVLALTRDPEVDRLWCAPGNAGTARLAPGRPLDVTDPEAVAALAGELGADLVVVGPEAPLVAGAADAVRAAGVPCFGPSSEAARIEGSKAYAKEVMAAAGVPTALARVGETPEEVAAALDAFGPPYVVKEDGLAAGKGVLVTADRAAALAHAAGCRRVVVEEYLDGPEVSLFVLTDGTTAVPLLPAHDFKRLGDGDTGPNTGGMGAYAPVPWAPRGLVADAMATVVAPTVDELRRRGTPFVGLLYAGLALTARGLRVVEFNCRFGDPETQAVLALLHTPLGGLLHAVATGRLSTVEPLRWADAAAVTVVLAAAGYPGTPRTGDVVEGLAAAAAVPGVQVLHGGTRAEADGTVRTAGGRVLALTAVGSDLRQARERAYAAAGEVRFPGAQYRRDVAAAAVAGRVEGGGAVLHDRY